MTPPEAPSFAARLVADVSSLGPIVASSSTVEGGAILAYAVAIDDADDVLVAAVAEGAPHDVVVMRFDEEPAIAMAVARSVVLRSGKKIAERGVASVSFGDLGDVPFDACPPQVAFFPAPELGVAIEGATFAVGATWAEMALDPEARRDAIRARTEDGLTGDVLAPLAEAITGLSRSLRKAKEPTLTNAAWVVESLLPDHPFEIDALLRELALAEKMSPERAEIVGALVDAANEATLLRSAEGADDGRPRVVVCEATIPKRGGAPSQKAVVYFHPRGKRRLEERHPEPAIDVALEKSGFSLLDALYEKHAPILLVALAVEGGGTVERGFHLAVSRAEARASFEKDGFVVVDLVLDG